jgi:hypothetical protein
VFKKPLAALAAVLLGVGLSVAAVATPAAAHTGDLNASAECVNGDYQVTYTLTIANTNLTGTSHWRIGSTDFEGTPNSNTGMNDSIPTNGSGQYKLTTLTLPGNSTKAPWAYAYSVWSDNYSYGSDGGDIALAGDCAPPPPIDVCPNIDGPQSVIPDGYSLDAGGNCIPTPPPPPTCVENPAVTYTYTKAENGGVISVSGDPNVKLCNDFYVTVASWSYQNPDNKWPQTLVATQPLHIEYPGDTKYGLPVQCGQGDVYASFDAQPVPPGQLNGPDNPWDEHFLHEMGFTGPNPTWVQTDVGCNAVLPQVPTADKADTCGEYGTLALPIDDQFFHYTVTGGKDDLGKEGIVTVTATVQAPYIVGLVNGQPAVTSWPLDLGFFEECVDPCAPDSDTPSETDVSDPACATAEVEFTPPSCSAPQKLVLGDITNAKWGEVTDPEGPNNYSVTATATGEATFAGGLKSVTFEGILNPKLPLSDPKCQLTDLDLVLPSVSVTNGTCLTSGSYTLGAALGFNAALLTWTVNGAPASNGTHSVSKTTELTFVATPVAPHGLEPVWVNPVVRTVTVPTTACGDLTTLALTGAGGDPTAPISIAAFAVLLGLVAVHRSRRSKAVR